ncbi:MAG: ABC transporter ATP-binding protein [archaeon]|nr:ABC transporter ATP-binding protein [archaeon]
MVTIQLESISKSFGATKVINNLSLEINDKEFLVFLGPSGCGKTTTLRCVAGLESIDEGKILVDGKTINDIPPQKRDVAMVFQNYALYPFMTVRDNLSFPLKLRGVSRDVIEKKVQQVSELLRIQVLLERKPKQLSGGEQQRVALGRALIRDPKIFLMDEPLSNLDAKLRVETRTEIKRLQRELGITTIFVTHDQAEAMALADRIAVLDKGVVQQIGSPNEIYHKPETTMVAQFMGSPAMNMITGTYDSSTQDVISIKISNSESYSWQRKETQDIKSSYKGEVLVGFRPEDTSFRSGPGDDGIPAEIYVSEPVGTHTILTLKVGEKLVKAFAPSDASPKIGERGSVSVKDGHVHLFSIDGKRVA